MSSEIDRLKSQSRQERLKNALKSKALNMNQGLMVRMDDICRSIQGDNVDHTVRDLYDILWSYYEVARKRFVDVVCMQGAALHLVTGPDTPLKVFSSNFVIGLKPEQLEIIAGEDLTLRRKRAELIRQIENLEHGKRILN